jgi:hypothetical protein
VFRGKSRLAKSPAALVWLGFLCRLEDRIGLNICFRGIAKGAYIYLNRAADWQGGTGSVDLADFRLDSSQPNDNNHRR